MNHVIGKKQRDFQATELHRLILHLTNILAGHRIKNRPDLTLFNHFANGFFRIIWPYADKTHLTNFFIERHFAQQIGDKSITLLGGLWFHQGVSRLCCVCIDWRQRSSNQSCDQTERAKPFHRGVFSFVSCFCSVGKWWQFAISGIR